MPLASLPLLVSKYRLMEEVGHGGMATVYRAEDTRLGREVAVKLIHHHLRYSSEIQTRFTSEARAIAKLRHPSIVEVFDVSDEDEAESYLVMELVRGGTLRELLARTGPLPVELAALVVSDLAAALEHAHGQGVIHRDIKPENVLVESSEAESARRDSRAEFRAVNEEVAASKREPTARVKLTDFGIAKLLDAQGVTSTGQVLGSPAHMAPEQIEGRAVDVRADVFSLAGLFYELVVGALPFEGNNPAQVLRNVLDGRTRAPETVKPEIGMTWSRIIMRGLARAPDDRYPTVKAFSEAIGTELAELGFAQTPRELGAFLADEQKYRADFVERIVVALSACAEVARARGELQRSTSQLSRALGYRPGDAGLLRQARRVRRRIRLRGALGYGAVAIALGLGIGAAVRWVGDGREAGEAEIKRKAVAASSAQLAVATASSSVAVVPAASAKPEKTRKPVKRSLPRRPAPALHSAAALPPTETRRVSVRVTGAVGGGVRIDGKTVQWFGVEHSLPVGEHRFEFVPPTETCCLGSRKVVRIEAGEGVQLISGRIPFKDAVLRVSSPDSQGFELSCPTLFGGSMRLPADRNVPMSQVAATGTCTVINSTLGETPLSKVITLRAGAATLLPWP